MLASLTMVVPVAKAAPPQDFKGIRIVVDPGHGGRDAGAIAPNGLTEKFINLSVSKYLAHNLRKAGATVKLTRSDDRFISLKGRAEIANRFKAHRFVAVHQNSAPNRHANGTETYFHKPQAAKLSKLVQNQLLKFLGHNNRGSRHASFAVIRRTNMPAILTEASFISQPSEAAKLVSGIYRQRQAMAIFRALQKDFGIKPEAAKPAPTPAPAPTPNPAPAPVVQPNPESVKPLEPAKLQAQFTGNFGIVQNHDVKAQVHIPYATGNDNLISVRNVGGDLAKPKIVFNDLLGNKVYEVEPFLKAADSYSFYPENIVGSGFLGSIDIYQSMGEISSGLSAGLVSE